MIENERQYRITRAEAKRFEEVLAHDHGSKDVTPRMKQAIRAGIESQLEDLREEMARFDALRVERIQEQ